jgi:hypothetical protein
MVGSEAPPRYRLVDRWPLGPGSPDPEGKQSLGANQIRVGAGAEEWAAYPAEVKRRVTEQSDEDD